MSEGGIFMQVLELGVISLDCVGETPERTRQECRVRFFLVVASSEPPPCGFPPMALISPSLIPLSAAPILLAPNSAYSRSTSAPTKKRPSSLAATPVVPDPLKGSESHQPKTTSHPLKPLGRLAGVRRVRSFRVPVRSLASPLAAVQAP